jgi:3-hydroxyacyl-[acyl-carrier-protein] dehydratase
MVPSLLLDLSRFDLNRVLYDVAEIERVNPHRGAMRLLDGVIHMDEKITEGIAFKAVRSDEFWVPGHIPGRPLFPGVLMIEAAAQLASFLALHRMPGVKFLGFAGVDAVKFRGQVRPGERLIIFGKEVEFRPRRVIFAAQAVVNGTLVFEGTVIGMPM